MFALAVSCRECKKIYKHVPSDSDGWIEVGLCGECFRVAMEIFRRT